MSRNQVGQKLWAAGAVAVLGAMVLTESAWAQQMPPRAEIERRVEEELEKIPPTTVESEHLDITYKAIPTDPVAYAKSAAGGQIPAGVDPDMIARQALPMIRPVIEKYAATLGTLTAKSNLKVAGKTLKEGTTYTFGLITNGTEVAGVLISGGDLKAPIKLPLKGAAPQPIDPMTVEIIADKRNDKKLAIRVGFARTLGDAGPLQAR